MLLEWLESHNWSAVEAGLERHSNSVLEDWAPGNSVKGSSPHFPDHCGEGEG
jgi:hypothetical protein